MPFHGLGVRFGQQVKFGSGRGPAFGTGGQFRTSFGSTVTDIGNVLCGGLTGTAKILCELGTFGAEAFRKSVSRETKQQVTEQKFDTPGGGGGPGITTSERECGAGMIRVSGICIDPSAALPGGDPLFTTAGGNAVAGGFGLPAFTPVQEQVLTRRCPKRMVLGFDNLCYPKAVLPPRSQFRKWKRPPSPTLSRRDEAAITRAASAKDRVLTLAKKAGLHASKTRPAPRSKADHQHLLSPGLPQLLKVISESTN